MLPDSYTKKIKERSLLRFVIGLLPRLINFSKSVFIVFIARLNGAEVHISSSLPFKLALKANKNLIVGKNCNIETFDIDLREKVLIKNNVIINKGCKIVRQSHDIDSSIFETIGSPLLVNDWCWLCTNATILPNCKVIGVGSIIGAFAVVSKSINEYEVFVGNPGRLIKTRKQIPSDILIPSLQGRDLIEYVMARIYNN